MSSGPLISHHLFVAAVKHKRSAARLHRRPDAPAASPQCREIPVELVEFGRPMPLEPASRINLFRRVVST